MMQSGEHLKVTGLALLLSALFAASAAVAQDWTPTVATAPGGTLQEPLPGALNREPTRIDPKYFPAPADQAPVKRATPPKVISPIETGAIPQSEPRVPARGAARQAEPAPVPPIDLSPIRPMPLPAIAAGKRAAPVNAASDPDAPAILAQGPQDAAGTVEPLFKKPGPLDALPPDASAAQQYCFNTADTAADARFAWQAKKIREMGDELDKRAQQLEAKTNEYKRWLARRDEFSRKAHEKLVGFYSRMRPDAAAVQIATLDEEVAAAVVMKLETKVASQIMGEMDPERAAKIALIISGAGKVPRDKRRGAAEEAAAKPAAAEPGDQLTPVEGSGS
ncbi:MotE family protein [Hyphomicrobium sp. CS1GBMeth3]|uniref:MotE family protein n=1 Tax=Hyphomicrobium sp. CS1GBMeth3 TaxID=1892845 RepID=UPI000931BDEB|nr:MotE family protein [Hyphomicrobium sp. CS1GBMeth3]